MDLIEAYVPLEESDEVDDNVDEEYEDVRCRAMMCSIRRVADD